MFDSSYSKEVNFNENFLTKLSNPSKRLKRVERETRSKQKEIETLSSLFSLHILLVNSIKL